MYGFLLFLVHIKMKDSSILSFKDPENAKMTEFLHRRDKDRVISGRKMEELNRVRYKFIVRFWMRMMENNEKRNSQSISKRGEFLTRRELTAIFSVKFSPCSSPEIWKF